MRVREPTFSVFVMGIAPANLKSMIALLNNSDYTVKIWEIWIANASVSAITGVLHDFRLFRITGFSAGSSVEIKSYDLNDTLPSNIEAKTNATVSGEESNPLERWSLQGDEIKLTTLDAPTMETIMQQVLPYFQIFGDAEKPLTLRKGQGIHIKELINTTVGVFDFTIVFTVSSKE